VIRSLQYLQKTLQAPEALEMEQLQFPPMPKPTALIQIILFLKKVKYSDLKRAKKAMRMVPPGQKKGTGDILSLIWRTKLSLPNISIRLCLIG